MKKDHAAISVMPGIMACNHIQQLYMCLPKRARIKKIAHPHITLLFGVTTDDESTIKSWLGDFGPFMIKVKNPAVVSPDGKDYDVVILDVEVGMGLAVRKGLVEHALASNMLDPIYDYYPFRPHISIGRITRDHKVDLASEELNSFNGRELQIRDLIIHTMDRKIIEIEL